MFRTLVPRVRCLAPQCIREKGTKGALEVPDYSAFVDGTKKLKALDRPPRAIRKLTEHGANALKENFNTGRYNGRLVSRRTASMLRKRAIIEGTFGSWSPIHGGWLPEWDEPVKVPLLKPNKGHKRERTREARFQKITKAMEGMPERIKKYREDLEERKPTKDIPYMFKRSEQVQYKLLPSATKKILKDREYMKALHAGKNPKKEK